MTTAHDRDRNQRWYCTIVRGLASQAWARSCDYGLPVLRSEDGTRRCALGWLLDADSPLLGSLGTGSLDTWAALNGTVWQDPAIGEVPQFLRDAQEAHDAEHYTGHGTLLDRIRDLGLTYGLEWPEDVPGGYENTPEGSLDAADYDGPPDRPNGAWSGGFAENH